MENEPRIPTQHEIEMKNEFQMELMKYAMEKNKITQEEWVDLYAKKFSEWWDYSHFISSRMEKAYDEDPKVLENLVIDIQSRLEEVDKE